MVPETVASWVCDHALTAINAANIADNVYGRKLFLTWASLIINSLLFFAIWAVTSIVRDGTALFVRQLPNRAHALAPAYYSKPSHFVNQRRTRQSKPIGRPVLPSDHPARLFQGFQDMLPIGVGKRACSTLRARLHPVLQVRRQIQRRPGRKKHRAFDKIL